MSIRKAAKNAGKHLFFKPSQLERWINLKENELELMADAIGAGNEIIFLSARSQLKVQLVDNSNNKFSLVLLIPPMDERTNAILESMEESIDQFPKTKIKVLHRKKQNVENEDAEKSWCTIQRQRKLVLDKIRELTKHAAKNLELLDQVQFIITFGERSKTFRCRYSVYRGNRLFKDDIFRLPDPPTGVQVYLPATNAAKRARTTTSSIRVEWDYEDFIQPCDFLVEYRLKGSWDSWHQQKTTTKGQNQMTISFETGSTVEIRVAAVTCVGCSDFSDVVDSQSAVVEEDVEDDPQTISKKKNIDKLYESTHSDLVALTTNEIHPHRFAVTLVKQSQKIGHQNVMDLFAVEPNGRLTTVERFVFGEPEVKVSGRVMRKQSKTILLIGESSSGKTSLINSLVNYVFNVAWEDPFRFQLIPEQVDDQKSSVYDVHYAKGFRIDYSLTIVDTPSFSSDEADCVKNQEIVEMIRKFINDDDGVQEVDMVCFVMDSSIPHLTPLQLYIYCSLITIFGNKIKENVNFLFNYADNQDPPLLSAIAEAELVTNGQPFHHKFNSLLFGSNTSSGRAEDFFWCIDNFKGFFASLATTTSKSMSVSRQAKVEMRRLEATLYGLRQRVNADMIEFEELRNTKRQLKRYWNDENVKFKLHVKLAKKPTLPFGEFVTYCTTCRIPCHLHCASRDGKANCDVMDHTMSEETHTSPAAFSRVNVVGTCTSATRL